jgi:hypothetical protein
MNADDQCLDLIKRQLPIPESFLLTEDGSHGIELYVVPWADTSGTKHVTIIVVGAKGAKVLAGGQTIEFTFRRQNSAHLFLHALSAQNSAKLTNPKIREAFNCFSEFYGKMMELRTHRISVSPECQLALLSITSNTWLISLPSKPVCIICTISQDLRPRRRLSRTYGKVAPSQLKETRFVISPFATDQPGV